MGTNLFIYSVATCVLNTEMSLLTLVICQIEFGMCCYLTMYALSNPAEKLCLWYLTLLVVLLTYNLCLELFFDSSYPVFFGLQSIVVYGGRFLIWVYFAFFLYKAFNLKGFSSRLYYGGLFLMGMSVLLYVYVDLYLEVLVTNSGFLLATGFFITRIVKRERIRDQQLEAKCILGRVTQVFDGNCERFGLSKREREIALCIAQGKQYKYIADELFISVDTVKTHVKNIFKKVEVNDKTELVFKLLQESVVKK